MLIFGPVDIQGEIADAFKTTNVPHEPLMLAPQNAGSGSICALMVAVGSATALATTALFAWFVQNRRRVKVSILIVDERQDRRHIEIESTDSAEIPFLLAQAREVTIEKRGRKRTTTTIKRVKLPALVRTNLIDEVRSCCPNPNCGKKGVRLLEAHHIDGNRSHTTAENLLMLCANCHGEADKQLISREEVKFWKVLLIQGHHPFLDAPNHRTTERKAPIVDGVNFGHAAQKMEVHYHGAKPPAAYPVAGTIEANSTHRAYVHYLGKRYIEWRLKGKSEMGDDREFNPDAAWSVIQNTLGFAPYKAGIESFPTVVEVITGMIDRTPFGSLNRSKRCRNYHSFDEHQKLMIRRKKSRLSSTSNP